AVDAANNLWIGSNMGLTKYNGTSFTTYNTSNSGLISDTITAIGCGNGNVYAGSHRGLSVYNGTNFSNYTTANGMNSNGVTCITVENANAIWIGSSNGIEKFNGSSFAFNYVAANNTADVVNCIYIDAQGNKWIGTNTHGVIKYDNSNFYTMQQLYPGNVTQEMIGVGIWPTCVQTICTGLNGGVFFNSIPVSTTGKYSPGRSFEIVGTQLKTYMQIISTATATPTIYTAQTLMQHDVGSNKIFLVNQATINAANNLLHSYSSIPFFEQTISPIDETTNNTAFLDINNVSALITDNSNQHWDATVSATKYFVPKQNNTSPLFTSALWIGGYGNGVIHMAAMTYRQNGVDFWPGPLDTTNATVDTATISAYNHVWKVNRFDIASFIYHWNAGDVQNGTWVPASSILTWPAQGTGNFSRKMAPYVDVNHNGVYDPIHDGDYPLIKGDQMIWSVFNDNAGLHGETGGKAMGIEIHASAYAFTCPNIADSNVVLNNTTFYNYQIFNRSTNQYDSTLISLWEDSDLGNYQDDYVGCDVMNDFGYTYNGDNYDEDVGISPGYHSNLPVFACNILSGPIADLNDSIDNNHNCVIDEPGERCMMNGFTYYNNSGSQKNGNPPSTNGYQAYYNLMNNHWEDGTYMTYGAQGLTGGGIRCKYLYPGTSDPYGFGLGAISCGTPMSPTGNYGATGWTEAQAGNAPGDRRFIVNVGKFTMQPGSMYELDYALVFSQDSANCDSNNTCVITRAVQDNQRVKHWFNTNNYPSCLDLSNVGIKQNAAPQLNLSLYPNPANTTVYVEFAEVQKNVTIEVFDMLGNLVQGLQYNELNKYAVIPVSMLQSGVYMVKIQSAEGTANRKFIKE
ncbi:MAG TPA: T9SS type A sorting domain-containing protein, partial [Bacteroidia bacterium]|nr:T9SS type A sorting domain-containing protein [Bacteroidia bacterium]